MSANDRIPGVPVRNVAAFLTRIRSDLIGRFGHGVRFKVAGVSGAYFLNDNRGVTALSKRETVPVVPILVDSTKNPTHWLALEVEPDLANDGERIGHVSIKVYKGLATQEDKTMLFRAEWDPRQALSVRHAQPHWHFLDETRPGGESGLGALRSLEEKEAFGSQPPADPYRHVHFAMSAIVDGAEWVTKAVSSEQVLHRWIIGVIDYTVEELVGAIKGAQDWRDARA